MSAPTPGLPASIDETLALLESASYVADRSLATVLFLSLRLGRPLFLEGEAGVGKTEIAKVLAASLGRRLIRLQCYEGLDVATAVYEWNYPAQMMAIRLSEAAGEHDKDRIEHDVFSERYLIKRPLLQAMEPSVDGPPVLADRRDRPRRRGVRGLSPRDSVGFPGDDPGSRRHQGARAADRRHHLEPHARDPRCVEAALPLSLDRLSGRDARNGDRARQGAARAGAADRRNSSPSFSGCASRTCSSRQASPRRSTGRRR